MSDYTPSIDQVRSDYVLANTRNHDSYLTGVSSRDAMKVHEDDFNRALTEHDRQVAERAWNEGLDAQKDYAWRCEDADAAGQWHIVPAPKNPYRKG